MNGLEGKGCLQGFEVIAPPADVERIVGTQREIGREIDPDRPRALDGDQTGTKAHVTLQSERMPPLQMPR